MPYLQQMLCCCRLMHKPFSIIWQTWPCLLCWEENTGGTWVLIACETVLYFPVMWQDNSSLVCREIQKRNKPFTENTWSIKITLKDSDGNNCKTNCCPKCLLERWLNTENQHQNLQFVERFRGSYISDCWIMLPKVFWQSLSDLHHQHQF